MILTDAGYVSCTYMSGGRGVEGIMGEVNFENCYSRVMLGRCVGSAVVSHRCFVLCFAGHVRFGDMRGAWRSQHGRYICDLAFWCWLQVSRLPLSGAVFSFFVPGGYGFLT